MRIVGAWSTVAPSVSSRSMSAICLPLRPRDDDVQPVERHRVVAFMRAPR